MSFLALDLKKSANWNVLICPWPAVWPRQETDLSEHQLPRVLLLENSVEGCWRWASAVPGTWWVALGLWLDHFFFCPSLCCEGGDAGKIASWLWVLGTVSTWILEGWPRPRLWESGKFEARGSAMECVGQ